MPALVPDVQHRRARIPRGWLVDAARHRRATGPPQRFALVPLARSQAGRWPSLSGDDLLPERRGDPARMRVAACSVADNQTRYIPFPRYRLPLDRAPGVTLI